MQTKHRHDFYRELGGRIMRRRQRLKINQKTLGAELGVSASQISKYENGRERIAADTLDVLCQVLGVPAAYFFTEQNDETATTLATLPADIRGTLSAHIRAVDEALVKASNDNRRKIK